MFLRRFTFLFISALSFAVACRHTQVTELEVGSVELNKTVVQHDPATDSILKPYKDSLDILMNVVVGTTNVAMPKERDKPETLLGNFVADICLQKILSLDYKSTDAAGTISFFNNGGLRSSLPKGPITRGNVFELMPFDNELVVVTLSGKKMWELIRYAAMSGGQPMAGMKLGIHPDKTPSIVSINNQPFDSARTYNVVTSDYLSNGGDKMDFFKNPLKTTTTGILIRNAILDYCIAETAKGNTLTAKFDERFYYDLK